MKHFFKTSLLITLLFHVVGHALIANEVVSTDDKSVPMSEVISDFKAHISTMEGLPFSSDTISLINDFLERYDGTTIIVIDKGDTLNPNLGRIVTESALFETLRTVRRERELSRTIQPESQKSQRNHYWIWIVAAVLVIASLLFIKNRKKEQVVITPPNNNNNNNNNSNNDIIIRRKTTSVLKKQSLEDVIENENYMKIDCTDFCDDSSVSSIYIKNTCIKEIYNMYAEDLRNPENPKEDGCMVLGRWVCDPNTEKYCVSLEHAVFPGDDAVFSEYELNFGAKIKLNIMTKLRKLRQETQLQYDLTCWVHSHPGIGVFFSNTDYSLHMLHKHPTHPKFLTAIVVDILTPQQELGIFTFKQDLSINSKADLKRLYSLEEWYKWAVESSRNAFKPEDHFNTLQETKERIETCHDIQLSNGAIIDMGLLATEHQEGYIGCIQGFVRHTLGNSEYVATNVSSTEIGQDPEPIGYFIVTTHCSIPSVRKVFAGQLGNVGFVLVYSTTDGLLTSIPIVNNDLCTDQNYYGEQQLEDLKIWTRRKR